MVRAVTAPAYATIRRGPMAADAFTQISNRLFRDGRISFKAKGLFGLISTHRDGYGINPRRLAAQSTDGLSAIRAGLKELEQFGYLVRDQQRRPDGTMGQVEYLITDMPIEQTPSSGPVAENPQPAPTYEDAQNRRSQPVTDYPHAVHPHAAHRTPKNNKNKNTSRKNTNPTSPLPPPEPAQSADASRNGSGGETGTKANPPLPAAPGEATAGQQLLWQVCDAVPAINLPAAAIRALGEKVDELLRRGWTPRRVTTALTVDTDGLTHPRSVITWRIDDLLATPTPAATPTAHDPQHQRDRPVAHECPGDDGLCGRPLRTSQTLCRTCAEHEGTP